MSAVVIVPLMYRNTVKTRSEQHFEILELMLSKSVDEWDFFFA